MRDSMLIGAVLLTCAALLAGCGASAIQSHARAATVTAGVLSIAGSTVADARSAAFDRVEAEHPTDPEHDAALDAEAARWRPVGAALDAARGALLTWVQALETARLAGEDADLLSMLAPLAARVALLYGDAAALMRSLGVDAPALPDALASLAESLGGGR